MITITAILRACPGTGAAMQQALLDVAANVAANEPGTLSFFVSRKRGDPTVFTAYERFTDQASMDAHNNAAAVAPLLRNHTADPCRRCRTGDLRGDLSQDRLT
jgi:quinol monooxygenase YgiN